MSPRPFTASQRQQLLALLSAGAVGPANATPEHLLSSATFSVLAILEREGLVASFTPANKKRRQSEWFLTSPGEAEARRLVREEMARG